MDGFLRVVRVELGAVFRRQDALQARPLNAA
jgi:hypothetical protein